MQDSKWGKLLDFTIIGVKMDVLIEAKLQGGPPKPLLLTDYQSMKEEQLKVKDQITVVHFPKDPLGFQKCSNTLKIIAIAGRSWSFTFVRFLYHQWAMHAYICTWLYHIRSTCTHTSHLHSALIHSPLGDRMSTLTFYSLTTYTWAQHGGLDHT